MDIALIAAGLAVYAWLLRIVHRQRVRKHLPWFAFYVFWEVLVQCEQLITWLVSHRLYFALYWWIEAAGVLLTVAAVRESFLRIFRGFTKMRWFRWSVTGVIAAVVMYSVWKTIYAPPVQASRLGSFVVAAEFLLRWGIAGIALLTFVLSYLLEEPTNTREDAVVTGFGIASFGFIVLVVSFSLFGTRFLFVMKYAPSMAYFIAAFMWIWVFSRPVEGFGFDDLGIGPEQVLSTIRRYRESVRRIRGK